MVQWRKTEIIRRFLEEVFIRKEFSGLKKFSLVQNKWLLNIKRKKIDKEKQIDDNRLR